MCIVDSFVEPILVAFRVGNIIDSNALLSNVDGIVYVDVAIALVTATDVCSVDRKVFTEVVGTSVESEEMLDVSDSFSEVWILVSVDSEKVVLRFILLVKVVASVLFIVAGIDTVEVSSIVVEISSVDFVEVKVVIVLVADNSVEPIELLVSIEVLIVVLSIVLVNPSVEFVITIVVIDV